MAQGSGVCLVLQRREPQWVLNRESVLRLLHDRAVEHAAIIEDRVDGVAREIVRALSSILRG